MELSKAGQKSLLKLNWIWTEVIWTERTGHASEIAYSLRNRDDLDLVVAVGGDGTMNEVASGLRGSTMLGIIPWVVVTITRERMGFLFAIRKRQ